MAVFARNVGQLPIRLALVLCIQQKRWGSQLRVGQVSSLQMSQCKAESSCSFFMLTMWELWGSSKMLSCCGDGQEQREALTLFFSAVVFLPSQHCLVDQF